MDFQLKVQNLKDSFHFLFNNSILSDIEFVVGDENDEKENFFAHKLVLCCRSPVFYAMFNGKMSTNSKLIRITDFSPKAFSAFLKYLYCDEIDEDINTLLSIYYIADMFIVPKLCENLIEIFYNNLNDDNVLTFFNHLKNFKQTSIKKLLNEILILIDYKAYYLFKKNSFKSLDEDSLKLLVNRKNINICLMQLMECCLNWSIEKCELLNLEINTNNQIELLKPILNKFKFNFLNLYLNKDKLNIEKYNLQNDKFKTFHINISEYQENNIFLLNPKEIKFKINCNEHIFLKGFKLKFSNHIKELKSFISFETYHQKNFPKNQLIVTNTLNENIAFLIFESPIYLKANFDYFLKFDYQKQYFVPRYPLKSKYIFSKNDKKLKFTFSIDKYYTNFEQIFFHLID